MPPSRGRRGRGGRGGRARGRGDRGGQRFGRNEARGRNDAFESGRIVEDEDIEQAHEQPESEEEFVASSASSSEDDEPVNRKQAYNLLLQSFGHNEEEQGPSKKKQKVEVLKRDHSEKVKDENKDANSDLGEPEDEENEDETPQDEADGQDEDPSDPYEFHFANPDQNELARRLNAITSNKWSTTRQPFGSNGQCTFCLPDPGSPISKLGHIPPAAGPSNFKQRLSTSASSFLPLLDDTEKSLASNIFAYRDVLFGGRTVETALNLRKLTTLHALNLVFKTRNRVLKNNARLSKEDSNPDIEYRDQGFTRPKVLILLPTRHSCVRLLDTLIQLSQPEQQENKKRFEDSFISTLDEDENSEYTSDYQELMQGNTDDMFRLGIKFTRKTLKYFSQFYNSDIIIASPLGLRQALEVNKSKKVDYDFLSSIELVILDQANALLMQNWQHVEYIFEHLNLQPQEAHGCDFSRVRNYYLDNNAKYLRQTVVLSAFITPELNTLFNKHLLNSSGKLKYQPEYKGAILSIGLPVKQTFSRFESTSPISDPDARFKYFTTAIIPSITRYPKPPDDCLGILIFIPSYFDFVRIRNYFATSTTTQNISFGSISENQTSAARETRRARSHFLSGKHSVLLYTGRAHHFFRYKLRGVKKVIFYGLPDSPLHYQEIAGGFLGTSINEGKIGVEEAGVRVLFSKYDGLKVERVVGSGRAGRLLKDKSGDTFDFV
ncbi:DUF1253-domain-containing protein [Tothia fuscella]|uniref:U3 small nucleolar RNA-associated protein 25 n=1 Tax=Tothia fuscella TaxID=1048955 RepID=A0A9P4NK36_9PEZI|nr:DUF1253-domain-containing protein [Tothia fuscella]